MADEVFTNQPVVIDNVRFGANFGVVYPNGNSHAESTRCRDRACSRLALLAMNHPK
jgi:hypothetical protein